MNCLNAVIQEIDKYTKKYSLYPTVTVILTEIIKVDIVKQ